MCFLSRYERARDVIGTAKAQLTITKLSALHSFPWHVLGFCKDGSRPKDSATRHGRLQIRRTQATNELLQRKHWDWKNHKSSILGQHVQLYTYADVLRRLRTNVALQEGRGYSGKPKGIVSSKVC